MAKTKAGEGASSLDGLLCFSVYATGHAFNHVYRPMLAGIGLTYPQYLVMVVLWAEDGRTVGELGHELFLESSTLTPILKRLAALGHVERARDKADERQVRVHLTQKGRALHHQAMGIPSRIAAATGLSRADFARLQADLGSIRCRLLAQRH